MNPIVLGMLGPFLVTLGFISTPTPDSDLWIDPKYQDAEPGREWGNDR